MSERKRKQIYKKVRKKKIKKARGGNNVIHLTLIICFNKMDGIGRKCDGRDI